MSLSHSSHSLPVLSPLDHQFISGSQSWSWTRSGTQPCVLQHTFQVILVHPEVWEPLGQYNLLSEFLSVNSKAKKVETTSGFGLCCIASSHLVSKKQTPESWARQGQRTRLACMVLWVVHSTTPGGAIHINYHMNGTTWWPGGEHQGTKGHKEGLVVIWINGFGKEQGGRWGK